MIRVSSENKQKTPQNTKEFRSKKKTPRKQKNQGKEGQGRFKGYLSFSCEWVAGLSLAWTRWWRSGLSRLLATMLSKRISACAKTWAPSRRSQHWRGYFTLNFGGESKGCLIKGCLNSTEIPKVGIPNQGFRSQGFRSQGSRRQGFRKHGKPTLDPPRDRDFQSQGFRSLGFRGQGFRKQGFRNWGSRRWGDSGPP